MTKLPEKNLLDGTQQPETTTGEFRLAIGNLRQFLSELLGNDSDDRQGARDVLGAQEKYRANAEGTADALRAGFDPPVVQLLHGLTVQVRATTANATTTPTFAANETASLPIVKGNRQWLMPGDIAGEGHWLELKYDEPANQWTLQNPAKGITGQVDRIATAEGTGDALVVHFIPPITGLADGVRIYVRAIAPNGSVTPSIKIDDLPDAIIGKGANQTLAVNDIAGAGHILELQWDESHTIWELQNPANGILPVVLNRQTVNDALGYVPYDSSNPSGFVTASGSCNYANSAGSVGGVGNPVPKDFGTGGCPVGCLADNFGSVYAVSGATFTVKNFPGTWRNITNHVIAADVNGIGQRIA